jgi:hypothetical protein
MLRVAGDLPLFALQRDCESWVANWIDIIPGLSTQGELSYLLFTC